MSNVVRLHKQQGKRLRLVRVDAPPVIVPNRAADQEPSANCLSDPMSGAGLGQGAEFRTGDESTLSERVQRAYEKGRAQGRAEAEQDIQRRLALARSEADDRIGALMEGIARQVRVFTASLEQDAYQFSLAVAGRIIKREIARDDEVVVRQVHEAIRRIVGVETITLRIHPEDEVLIRSHRAALLASADTVREVAIESDDTIERGGCIIVSSSGNVDARITTQLRQIDSALFVHDAVPQERTS